MAKAEKRTFSITLDQNGIEKHIPDLTKTEAMQRFEDAKRDPSVFSAEVRAPDRWASRLHADFDRSKGEAIYYEKVRRFEALS